MFETSTRRWTVRELMRVAIDFLHSRQVDEARLTVELLLAHTLRVPRIRLYTHHDLPLSADELQAFRLVMKRRLRGEPVQYIVGEAHFMGMAFEVDTRVLIPRPETETLVEQVLLWSRERGMRNGAAMLDIGTGSGNIAVACARLVPGLQVLAVDNSEPALDLARANAARHGAAPAVTTMAWDMNTDPPPELLSRFDLIVSNPPYIPLAEWERLPPLIRDHEPQRALTDGSDGHRWHQRIASIAHRLLKGAGPLYLEIADGQAERVCRIMKEAGGTDVSVIDDLSRVPRVVRAIFSAGSRQ